MTSSTSACRRLHLSGVPDGESVSPSSGSDAGGTRSRSQDQLHGASTSDDFGTTAATTVTVNSPTEITAVSPAGSDGTVDMTVTTPGGTSATPPQTSSPTLATRCHIGQSRRRAYLRVGPPSPSPAPTSPATRRVDFGSSAAASYTIDSSSSITAVSPAGSGTVDMTVTNASGTSSTSLLICSTMFGYRQSRRSDPTAERLAGGHL